MATNESKANDQSKANHKPSTPASVAKPAATSAKALKRRADGRRDPNVEVSAEVALRDLESLRPNVGRANPNPEPRPGKSSQSQGRLDDSIDLENDPEERELRQARAKARIKVQATQMGYYDHIRRRPGDIFTISGETLEEDVKSSDGKKVLRKAGTVAAFSEKWMRRVAGNTPLRVTTVKEALQRNHDETLSKKMGVHEGDDVNQNPAARGTGDVDLIDG